MPVTIPPFTNVPAPGDPVASPWAQALTQFAVDQYVAQPGTPASAYTELWFDTDDVGGSFPNMPRGLIQSINGITTDQSGIGSTITDVTNLAITWTADPSRQYRTQALLLLGQVTTNAQFVDVQITDGANNVKAWFFVSIDANKSATVPIWVVESGLSGTQTRKVRVKTSAGTVTVQANSVSQSKLVVEDIGAVGAGSGGAFPTFGAESANYTPTIANMTASGNTGHYHFVGGMNVGGVGIIRCSGRITIATMGTGPTLALPAGFNFASEASNVNLGQLRILDQNPGAWVAYGMLGNTGSLVNLNLELYKTDGTYLVTAGITPTVPMTWAALDDIYWSFVAKVVRV